MKTLITLGYVQVYVPVVDCEGTQRTIDFPRIGATIHGQPRCHESARKYIAEAKTFAKQALLAAYTEAEYDRIAMM